MNDMQIHVAADSNIGLRRRANQDSFIIDDGVFLVCDGMGGGVGGQRASSAAVDRFETLASRFSRSRTTIGRTIDLAQADVLAIGQELGGVSGTTVTGLIAPGRIERDAPGDVALEINPDMDWYVINIGDSRTYHMDADSDGQWDASTLCRITRDHSRRQEAIDSGEMLPEDAVIIPRNIITQCIGDRTASTRTSSRSDRPAGSSSARTACTAKSMTPPSPPLLRHARTRRPPSTN